MIEVLFIHAACVEDITHSYIIIVLDRVILGVVATSLVLGILVHLLVIFDLELTIILLRIVVVGLTRVLLLATLLLQLLAQL